MFSKSINSKMLDNLYQNEEFCKQLGKVIVCSSKLGEQLLVLLKNEQINNDEQKPSLSMLIKYIDKKEFFPSIVPLMNQFTEENIDFLLNNLIKENITTTTNEETSVDTYINCLITLETQINLIYEMIKEHNKISL